jgi:hypothetical protein
MGRPAQKIDADKPRKPKGASRINNGTALFFVGQKQNGAVARLIKDNLQGVLSDLGGAERCSMLETKLARRCAVLDAVCVAMEAKFAAGDEVDVNLYVTTSNALNRIASTLGLSRRPVDVAPSLEEYLASKAAARDAEDTQTAEDGDGDGRGGP